MEVESFSFRYGKQDGFMAWYRLQRNVQAADVIIDFQKCREDLPVHIEKSIGMDAVRILDTKLQEYEIEKWDGFCEFAACLCAGDGWALHIRNTDKTEVHAMGHSAYPEGFFACMDMLHQFFGTV